MPIRLCIEDDFLARTTKLTRYLNRPQKYGNNPVIASSETWEAMLSAYGSVLFDGGIYKAYYTLWWLQDHPPYACQAEALAYAYSEDGIHWVKPSLGIITQVNQGRNNLIRFGKYADQPCVLRLAQEHAGYRYVMAYYGVFPPEGAGIRICFSNDGIHWDWPGKVVWQTGIDVIGPDLDDFAADDTMSFFFDSHLGKYVLLRKVMQSAPLVFDANQHADWRPQPGTLQRIIARCESEDLRHWENHQVVLVPDLDDAPQVDFHRLSATPYANGYIGLLEVHHGAPDQCYTALHLVHSRDGIQWQRPCRHQPPFLPRGKPKAWDGGVVFTTPTFLVDDDQLRFYYGGMQASLTEEAMGKCRDYGVGLATLAKDRFVSLRTHADDWGFLWTKPLVLQTDLCLNAVVTAHGSMAVALLDEANQAMAGFGWDDCDLTSGDWLNQPVTWAGRSMPGAGKYQLAIRMKNADLFGLSY